MRTNVLKNKDRSMSTVIICVLSFIAVMTIQLIYMYPFEFAIAGHDAPCHLLRIEAVANRLKDFNSLIGGVDYTYVGGMGYAGSMYPDLLMIIPAIFRCFGLSIGYCSTIYLFILNFLTYFVMYKCVKGMTGSMECGTIAAVAYSLAQYRLDNVFTRSALGEVQAYIFWPLIIYGLYDLIFKDFKKPWLLAIGYGGILLSHTLSTALAVVVGVVFVLVYIKRIIKDKQKILKIFKTAGVTLVLTAFYWIPLLETIFSCDLNLFHPIFKSEDNTVKFMNVFQNVKLDSGAVGVGVSLLIMCMPIVLFTKKSPIRKTFDRNFGRISFVNLLIIFSVVLIFFATDIAPWSILKYVLNFLQFPWRLFAVVGLMLSIAGALLLYFVFKHANTLKLGVCFVVAVLVFTSYAHLSLIPPGRLTYYDEKYMTTETDFSYTLSCGEWLPRKLGELGYEGMSSLHNRATFNDGTNAKYERDGGTTTVELGQHKTYVDVPYTWYKGYKAYDSKGNELETSMSDKGTVRVDLKNASLGTITVSHTCTPIRLVGILISLLGYVDLVIFLVCKKRKYKSKNRVVADRLS